MATNQQRRAAERRLLQKQLEQRRRGEIRRRRLILSGSIAGTLVVIAAVVLAIVLGTGGGGDTSPKAGGARSTAAATSGAAGQTEQPGGTGGVPASYKGVVVKNSTNLKADPGVTSTSSTDPTTLEYKDLVVGTGKAASPSATVSVQYSGVLYRNGKAFDSSWSRGGQPASFSLQQVVPGFTQGIGGTTGVPPMKVGGRRIMILPAKLGYGAQAQSGIPANSSLVFVVDLTKIGS